jgi:hypothetical protein
MQHNKLLTAKPPIFNPEDLSQLLSSGYKAKKREMFP